MTLDRFRPNRPDPGDRSTALRTATAVLALAAIVVSLLVAVLAPAAAQDGAADSESLRVKSVQFDLASAAAPADDPLQPAGVATTASYNSIVLVDGATEIALEPLPGTVSVSLDQASAEAMTAELDGLRLGHAAPEFANALADSISSASLHRFARLATTADGGPARMTVLYPRALGPGDFLLVQEGEGDGQIELTGVDGAGAPIGQPVLVGPGYQWNTGHGPGDAGSSWITVLPAEALSAAGGPIAGVIVAGHQAEVKVVALGPPPAPAPAAEPDQPAPAPSETVPAETGPPAANAASAATEPEPVFASVGLAASVKSAVAVGGAGCGDPATSADPGSLDPGQAATICFAVTNLGSTMLADIEITDPSHGLVHATLPKASGPDVLAPGETTIYYYHTAATPEIATSSAVVTALPVDDSGTPIAGLVAPSSAPVSEAPPEVSSPRATQSGEPDAAAPPASSPSSGPVAAAPPITQLALTGMVTEPWVLVVFAMAFIFIGYTAYAAFRRETGHEGKVGHEQLDELGFE